MDNFLKVNKNLIIYFFILLVLILLFGFNFFLSFLGNLLLLSLLIPILLLLVILISFNSYKSKINICSNCGSISLGESNDCIYCGAEITNKRATDQFNVKASEKTIEVKAEEVD